MTNHPSSANSVSSWPVSDVRVMTVLGEIDVESLGVTLMHEHTLRAPARLDYTGVREFSAALRHERVTASNAWLVREDPYACFDNREIEDVEEVAGELESFISLGGRTLVDNSNGSERDPALLVQLSHQTGLNIVMGSGWSVTPGVMEAQALPDASSYAAELVQEHREGIDVGDGRIVRPGIIGEIGVGPDFTHLERVRLEAAALAQRELGVPLLIHLPGWKRRAHEVLDVVLAAGVDPRAVVLCHMDPSGSDPKYQRDVASRGVWLEFDMIGMPNFYPGEGQSPPVDSTVDAVSGLIADGFASQLLLSQDVGMKTMWTKFGGNGYGFVQRIFLPRLVDAGVPRELVETLLTQNPRSVFIAARISRSSR